MRKKYLLLFSAILITGFFASGQDDTEKNGPRQIGNKYAIKITPTQMIMGELNLGIEFKTSRRTSIEIELGPTLSQVGLGGRNFEENDGVAIERTGSIGYFGALGFRYYPFEKTQSLNRLYISPQLKYRVYNTILSEDTGLWEEESEQNVQYKFFFNAGYQLWASKSFGFDFYLGSGLGYKQVASYSPISTYTGTGYEYTWDEDIRQTPQMLLNFGIKVSVGG